MLSLGFGGQERAPVAESILGEETLETSFNLMTDQAFNGEEDQEFEFNGLHMLSDPDLMVVPAPNPPKRVYATSAPLRSDRQRTRSGTE